MNRRSVLSLSAITALGVAISPSTAVSQQKSLKDQLVGTWTVVSWEQTNTDGTKLQRFGADPKGVNVFDANGRFVITFMRSDLPKVSSGNLSNPTPDEAKAIAGGSIAYYGTYTVDEAAKVVTLRIEATTLANQLGRDQKRTIVSLTADELKYTNTTPVSAGPVNITLKRAGSAAVN